jgi:Predicted transcriptional regulator
MIVVNLDVMLAKRKMTLSELADEVGITLSNMSILKTGKVRAVRISTLDTICRVLDCNVGDILDYQPDESVQETSYRLEIIISPRPLQESDRPCR